MNITELFSSLPDEIKKIILDKLPIKMLVDKDSTKIINIIDEYIKEYIETKILYNMSKSGYLYNTILYKTLVRYNIDKLSLYYAKKFILYSKGLVNLNNYLDKNVNIISLKIIFKFTKIGNIYSGSNEDSVFIISNECFGDINKCNTTYYNTTLFIDYEEDYIKSSIYNVLIREMDISDTKKDIKSIQIINTTFPEGIMKYNLYNEEILYDFY